MRFTEPTQLPLFDAVKSTQVSRARLPTNTLSHRVGVQRWANFVAGFSVEFVQECLAKTRPGGRVLDPFMGCGTTIVAARMSGFDSVGYEPHPVFGTLAEVKARVWEPSELIRVLGYLRNGERPRRMPEPVERFLSKLFSAPNLNEVMTASHALDTLGDRLYPLGVAVVLKAAEFACNSATDGIYKAPTTSKKSVAFDRALKDAERMFREDIASPAYMRWAQAGQSELHLASSTSMPQLGDSSVSAVVTSPPYLNNFDFAEMTRMQLYILGMASSWAEITETVRANLITNTTTAPKSCRSTEYQAECRALVPDQLASSLDETVTLLAAEKLLRPGKKPYDSLVFPYYRQILDVIRECYRVLESGGAVNWVVSDAALYGTYVPTHQHTAVLMADAGFRGIEIHQLRKRGHRWKLDKRDGAPGRLGEYHIVGIKP